MYKDIRFYDTSSLLIGRERIFAQEEKFVISSITLQELEQIKSSSNKDADIKYAARGLLRLLTMHQEKYEIVIHASQYETPARSKGLEINNDIRILMDAYWYHNYVRKDEVIFVTNDFALHAIANLFFGDGMLETIEEDIDDYTGYKEVTPNDEQWESIYTNPQRNEFGLYIGEYLILKNQEGEIKDIKVWTGSGYRPLRYDNFDSKWFGKVMPYRNDIYQKLLFDSLNNNALTIIRGPAGVGKSFISLAYLMQELDRGRIDNIIIFCNTVATRDAAKLGYYPGSRDEKLLDSQIGNFLIGKFGGIEEVERLITSGKLLLIPVSDIRGFDIKPNSGVYVTEAQNTSVDIMQLILQRIGEDCICIIEGDDRSQVDLVAYSGANNGLKKAAQVFRGQDYYGEVTLKNCYRSRIAKQAELMRAL